MFACHQDEKTFWRTMNPARLHMLFDAYFADRKSRSTQASGTGLVSNQSRESPKSLAAYLMGG